MVIQGGKSAMERQGLSKSKPWLEYWQNQCSSIRCFAETSIPFHLQIGLVFAPLRIAANATGHLNQSHVFNKFNRIITFLGRRSFVFHNGFIRLFAEDQICTIFLGRTQANQQTKKGWEKCCYLLDCQPLGDNNTAVIDFSWNGIYEVRSPQFKHAKFSRTPIQSSPIQSAIPLNFCTITPFHLYLSTPPTLYRRRSIDWFPTWSPNPLPFPSTATPSAPHMAELAPLILQSLRNIAGPRGGGEALARGPVNKVLWCCAFPPWSKRKTRLSNFRVWLQIFHRDPDQAGWL